jgi:putative transposase
VAKSEEKIKDLREDLAALAVAKSATKATSRRYSETEIELILKGAEEYGVVEASELSGVRNWTIYQWRRRRARQASESKSGGESKPSEVKPSDTELAEAKPIESEADQHSGYHKHWKRALEIWRTKPGLGPAQISSQMLREGKQISVTTVRAILEENGYTPPMVISKPEKAIRYEAARPRELVHMDFKHFYINKQKSFLLILQDDYSRFLCGHRLTDSENMDTVIAIFEECVKRYGRMQTIMTDAGSAFYSWNGVNRFQKLIADEYGVDHIKAGSPRSNGKVESVNKQIEKELLRVKDFSSLEEASLGIAEWVEFYNFERTHMGLPSGEVPADRFLYGWNKHCAKASSAVPPKASGKNDVWEEILRIALTKIK